jgi:curved DNA-binding protein CbpA
MRTYYEILGIKSDSTQDDIRAAFRSAAKKHHPDLFPSYIQKVRATAKMKEINAAYAVLRNPESRRKYDATLLQPNVAVNPYVVKEPAPEARSPERAPAPAASKRMSPENFWPIIVWLVGSFVLGYLQWRRIELITPRDLLRIVAVSLVLSPVLLMMAFMVLAVPIIAVTAAFSSRFESRHRAIPARKGKISLDLLLRLIGLGAVIGVGTAAWDVIFASDLLALGFLAVAGGLIGEITAMVVYLCRRSVVNSTEMLLRIGIDAE